jgi:hypothetical protein
MKKIFTKIYTSISSYRDTKIWKYFFNSLPKPCEPQTLLDIHVQELRDALSEKLNSKNTSNTTNNSTMPTDSNFTKQA